MSPRIVSFHKSGADLDWLPRYPGGSPLGPVPRRPAGKVGAANVYETPAFSRLRFAR